jgi:hypothetical protein
LTQLGGNSGGNLMADWYKVKDNAATTLASPLATGATSCVVTNAATLPSSFPYLLWLWDRAQGSRPSNDPNRELVKVTGATGNTLSIVRAVQGTDGNHGAGEAAEVRWCLALYDGIRDYVDAQSGGGGVTDHGALTGLADDDHTQYHTDARGDARYALLAKGVTNGDGHDHAGGDGAQVAYSGLSGTPDLSSLHARGHAVASTSDHTDWPSGLTATELGYVDGVTSGIQTQLDEKAATGHNHAGTYAPAANGVTNGDSHDHAGGDGGQVDHGGLTGLSDDDHSQYHTNARGDARYALAAKGVTNGDSHDHVGGDGAALTGLATTAKLTVDRTNNTTSLADVTGLSLAIAANKTYHFKFVVIFRSDTTTTGIKLAVNGPSGFTDLAYQRLLAISTSASGYGAARAYDTMGSSTGVDAANANMAAVVEGVVVNGSTAGDLILRFAAETTGTVKVVAGSCGLLWLMD